MLTISSEANWPLNFVAEITTEDNKRYSYQPRSDFLFSLNRCPRINIEVCSDPIHEHDRYRLLLQAGLLVRAMNMIETQRSQFVSVAIYIGKELSASWHLVYQPDRNTPTVGITNSLIADHWSSFLYRSSIPHRTSTLNHPMAGSSSFAGSTISPLPFLRVIIVPASKHISPN